MKKRTSPLIKTIYREIRDSLGRYLAIVGIIALGSSLFTGLKVTRTAMLKTGDEYISANAFFDYQLISTLGWEQSQVEAIAALEGVETAAGSVTTDFLADIGDNQVVLKAHMLTQGVNEVELVSGRMPQSDDECLADSYTLVGMAMGDRITVADGNDGDTAEMFAHRTYTIVGLVRTPMYINFERGTTSIGSGTVSGFVYIPPEGFAADYYTEIYLTLSEGGVIYSDEYKAAVETMEPVLTDAARLQADMRYDKIVTDADAQLDEAWLEYGDGLSKYDEGLEKYNDGLLQYEDGLREYEDGVAEFEEQRSQAHRTMLAGYFQLVNTTAQLDEAETQLKEALSSVSDGLLSGLDSAESWLDSVSDSMDQETYELVKSALAEVRGRISSGLEFTPEMYEYTLAAFDEAERRIEENGFGLPDEGLEAALSAVRGVRSLFVENIGPLYDAYVQISDGRAQVRAGWQQWHDGVAQAEAEFAQAEDAMRIARLKLDAVEAELLDAERELADARAELSEGETELLEAREELEQLKRPEVYVLDRSTNVGYVCFENDSLIVDGIATVFPFFFFAVAALVCITTMTRMVDDDRGQIGTLKALGYGQGAIMSRYLIYTGSASAVGCAIGVTVGSVLFPSVVWIAYGMMYSMPDIIIVFDIPLMLISSISYLVLAMGVTWFSCRKELAQPAAELIRPKSPPAGKRIWLEHIGFIWKRIGFLKKVSLRNVFRYHKRLIMMVLGIGGCTALLLTGFGLDDSITNIGNRQFDEISIQDASVNFSEDMSGGRGEAFFAGYEGVVTDYVLMYSASADCVTEEHTGSVTVCAAEDFDDFEGLMNFAYEGEQTPYPQEGQCIISTNLAERYAVEVGDRLTITVNDTDKVSMQVAGIFSNVIYNYVYTNISTLEAELEEPPVQKLAYINLDDSLDLHEAAAKVAGGENVVNVSVTQDAHDRVNNMLDSMGYIVMLIIGCAGALAFIVLFNLTNINIIERIREIATIKVLGFNSWETAEYVFRENIILTVCGCAAGIPMGIWLHGFVMSKVKIDMISFEPRITWLSYVLAAALTFAFTMMVNLFMLPRLEKINMAEALKSVE